MAITIHTSTHPAHAPRSAAEFALRDSLITSFYQAYPLSRPSSEVITGEMAKDFAGEMKWSRALDFPVRGMPSFKGLRYIDFKDCTNVYALMKDGASSSVYDLTTRHLQAVGKGLQDLQAKLRVKPKGPSL